MQKSLSSSGICEKKSRKREKERDKSSTSGSHACLIPQCAEIILRYSSRGIQMNPSALFTYARARRSLGRLPEKSERKKRVSLRKTSFRVFFPSCSASLVLYATSLEPFALFPLFFLSVSLLANLHILPFSRVVMNNPSALSIFFAVSFASLSSFCQRVNSFSSVIYLSRGFFTILLIL